MPQFDEQSVRRITRAVLAVEKDQREPDDDNIGESLRQPVAPAAAVHFLQVVDLTPVATGVYKARIESFDPDTYAITLFPPGPDYVLLAFTNGMVPVTSFSFPARRYGDQLSGRALYRSMLDLGPLNGTCTPIYVGCNDDGTPIIKYLRLPALCTVTDTPC